MSTDKQPPGIWFGQTLHFVCLSVLLALVWIAWRFLGKPFPIAFWTAVAFPIVHQVFVWLAWRSELHSGAISKALGFGIYYVIFFVLFIGRFVSLAALGWLDRGSLNLPVITQNLLTLLFVLLGGYAVYSVARYFGFVRASGADHFDPKYREMGLVKKGIFRFTNNGMYIYAFLLFWAIAIGFNSSAALVVAAFSHAYIWVHFYATEKPDMEYLYGQR